MTSLPTSTEILIVGGGPTGLALALALQKNGCEDLVVVDAIEAGENTSRAMAMHAATLEALDTIGCAEDIVKGGIITSGGHMWDGYRFHHFGDFSCLKGYTKFPYLLFCPQNITERVLGQRCKEQGVTIVRPVKVVDLKINEANSDYTDVIFENGHVLKAHYVVGADGTKSIVRTVAGISYADPDGATDASDGVVADVIFASDPPTESTKPLFILTHGTFFLALPLPAEYGERAWRVAIGVPNGTPPHAPPTEYLQGLLDAYGPAVIPQSTLKRGTPLTIARTIWSARFRTDSAVSSTPFARLGNGTGGAIALIGDAAHKHPPNGGQGLNLGLRDAVFLAPVLAAHSAQMLKTPDERATADKPLQAWADIRHERALRVIRLAKDGHKFSTWKDERVWYLGIIPVNWVRVRNFMLWLMEVTGYANRIPPWQLSGLKNP